MSADDQLEPDWVGTLHENEHIQWQGRPFGGLLPLTADRFFVVFVWVFLAFSLVSFLIVLTTSHSGEIAKKAFFVSVTGALFAGGVYLTIWQHVSDAFLRHHTQYALSNFRAFIGIEAFGKRWLQTYPINPFSSSVELDQDYAGGTVWFAKIQMAGDGETVANPWEPAVEAQGTVLRRIGFVGIPDVRDVYDRIRQIQALPT